MLAVLALLPVVALLKLLVMMLLLLLLLLALLVPLRLLVKPSQSASSALRAGSNSSTICTHRRVRGRLRSAVFR